MCSSSIMFFQPRKLPEKKRITSPENQTIGVTILLVHLLYVVQLHGMAKNILLGWHESLWTLPTIRHLLLWILVVHGRLDRYQPSECSRNMRCTMALQQNSAPVNVPCVGQLWDLNLVGKLYYSLSDNTSMNYRSWWAWETITCPACGLHSSQLNFPQWDIVLDLTSLAYQPKLREQFAHRRDM